MEKMKGTGFRLLLALIVLIIGFAGGYKMAKDHFEGKNGMVTDTLIVEHWDTLIVEKPHEVVRYVTRHDTIKLTDEPRIVITIDSTAIIPIEQAVYQDSTESARYTAFVSGFRPCLDSIYIESKSKETIITNTITKQPRRIGFGLQCGIGISPKGIAAPYLGVGVQYRIW